MIILKKLIPNKHVSKNYVKWMNDPAINNFLEQRFIRHTKAKIKKYIINSNKKKNEYLFGIFLKKTNQHIGNIKLGSINYFHKTAIISYFIGEKKLWGKNYATLAIKKILTFAKIKKIKKVQAMFYKINKRSESVLKKNNFRFEGEFKSQYIFKNKRISSCVMGKIL